MPLEAVGLSGSRMARMWAAPQSWSTDERYSGGLFSPSPADAAEKSASCFSACSRSSGVSASFTWKRRICRIFSICGSPEGAGVTALKNRIILG